MKEKIIRVITLYQPWATLLAYGIKKNETRPGPTSHTDEKGIYLIHAAKKWTKEQEKLCNTESFKSALNKCTYKVNNFSDLFPLEKMNFDIKIANTIHVLPIGCIIGSFEVKKCKNVLYNNNDHILIGSDYEKIKFPEYSFGNYNKGRSIWIGQNHKVLKYPIPYKGQQGYYAKFKGDINQLKFK